MGKDDEYEHLPSEFYYPEECLDENSDETSVEESRTTESQEEIEGFLKEQKSANTSKNERNWTDFERSRKVPAARRKSLIHEHGKSNKLQAAAALEDEEEDALFEIGEFGDSNQVSLQRTVWWLLSLHSGFRARDESRKLRWGDVQLQQDKDGEEMLVWLAERGTKTRHGQEKGHRRAFQPKVYAIKAERCPVKFYKTFKTRSPLEMNQKESPFYLAVRQNRTSQDQVWYMRSPLGKNEIGKFLSTAAQKAGLHREGKRVTNHSDRKTLFQGYSMLIFQKTSLLNSVATKARKAYNNTNQPAPTIKEECC
ncbi:uncharacterized protein [Acropora muricata]|uniref:uncharacterized protein n=1 Tax=Acropora muricata TaxID=159855 RepID=UPI0034E4C52C